MKKSYLVAILFTLLAALGLTACGPSGPAQFPASNGKHVNDFANVLEDGAEKSLESYLLDFKKRSGVELAVVTTPSLYDLTLEQYSIKLAEKWGVGGKKNDTGVIILLAPSERKLRIEVGYGLEEKLTDIQCRHIIDDIMLPKMRAVKHPGEAQFTSAVLAGVDGVLVQLGQQSTPFAQPANGGLPTWAVILIFLLVGILRVIIAINGGGGGGGRYGGGWSSGGRSSGGFGGGRFGGGGASGSW